MFLDALHLEALPHLEAKEEEPNQNSKRLKIMMAVCQESAEPEASTSNCRYSRGSDNNQLSHNSPAAGTAQCAPANRTSNCRTWYPVASRKRRWMASWSSTPIAVDSDSGGEAATPKPKKAATLPSSSEKHRCQRTESHGIDHNKTFQRLHQANKDIMERGHWRKFLQALDNGQCSWLTCRSCLQLWETAVNRSTPAIAMESMEDRELLFLPNLLALLFVLRIGHSEYCKAASHFPTFSPAFPIAIVV